MRLQGRWHGALGAPGDSTSIFIDVDTLAGRLIAEADIPGQEVRDFPLDIEVISDTVRFHLSRSGTEGPVLTFVVPARGTVLNGTFTDSGTKLPARLSRMGPPKISPALLSILSDSPNAFDVTVLSPDARELREQFNQHADHVRLVMLLSPT